MIRWVCGKVRNSVFTFALAVVYVLINRLGYCEMLRQHIPTHLFHTAIEYLPNLRDGREAFDESRSLPLGMVVGVAEEGEDDFDGI